MFFDFQVVFTVKANSEEEGRKILNSKLFIFNLAGPQLPYVVSHAINPPDKNNSLRKEKELE